MDVAPDDAVGVSLLGAPRLQLAPDQTLALAAERAHVLLAWLAMRRAWVRRDEVAVLLYPEHELDAARRNLRKVLHLARKLPLPVPLDQQGDLLAWQPDTDVQRFEAACRRQAWDSALQWYGGAFLLGLDAGCKGPLQGWLDHERARLAARWHEACTRRLDQLQDDPLAARAVAEILLREDPTDEIALTALGRAQARSGQHEDARLSVQRYRARLAEELQLEPSSNVRQLWRELHLPTDGTPAEGAQTSELPSALVGRRLEQTQIEQRLVQEGVRVLTLLGPGGIGKSTLARDAALRLAVHWPAGAHWIALQDLADADAVPGRIASTLGIALPPQLPPWQGLAQALGPQPRLLVLDNTEQIALAAALQGLLLQAPRLQLLVTSREPLGLPEEWRLPLAGLPLPDRDETDPEVLSANDGVRLFDRRARAAWPEFRLKDEAADLVPLLHAVDGLPLAIELLAAWRRLMPVAAMREELQSSVELLQVGPAGGRSLVATFDSSWRRLSPLEQRTLARLAVLPGPIPRDMARRVVPAPLAVLAHLVDKSLLQVEEDGSLVLHPLIRRLAAEHADDVPGLQLRHLRELRDVLVHLAGDRAAVRTWFDRHLNHVQAAWDTAVSQRETELLALAAPSLEWHADLRSHAPSCLARFDEALRALPDLATLDPHAKGQLDTSMAGLYYQLGHPERARGLSEASLRDAQARNDDTVALRAHMMLARLGWLQSDISTSNTHRQRASALAHRLRDRSAQSSVEHLEGLALKVRGDYRAALDCYQRALAEAEATDDIQAKGTLLNNIGNCLRALGRVDEARVTLERLVALGRRHGLVMDLPYAFVNLGLLAEAQGQLEGAQAFFDQSLAVSPNEALWTIRAAALLGRARVGRRPQDIEAALAIGRQLQSLPILAHVSGSAGRLLALQGRAGIARRLLRAGIAHPALGASEREDQQRWLAAIDGPEEDAGPAAEPAFDDDADVLPAALADVRLEAALAEWSTLVPRLLPPREAPQRTTSEAQGSHMR